ncbi:unnamed protein product, partial [Musa hybrid cultivar]
CFVSYSYQIELLVMWMLLFGIGFSAKYCKMGKESGVIAVEEKVLIFVC